MSQDQIIRQYHLASRPGWQHMSRLRILKDITVFVFISENLHKASKDVHLVRQICFATSTHIYAALLTANHKNNQAIFRAAQAIAALHLPKFPVRTVKSVINCNVAAEYEAYARRRAEREAAASKAEPPEKKQVRLPVVIVQPDDDVKYGRAESQYFPKRALEMESGNGPSKAKLPDTPPKGSYYIEGQLLISSLQ